ncbi:Non-specific serine/threonine protein kinase [Vibrio chagasii]|uniref:protein kinase domain-containing protein n=1 Tax=Vibrio splendidus TaxID=29497 RepID=UPI001F080F8B|nr:AarF/UbiB family protein [Vibrio splendidus]CAH6860898.1 Non-specific serine/threonine protein kinase [Vibrio chagasii]CAH7016226.1 Non-specific serine/threonine protein kinase [Vibrio chagasii]CAH7070276.1 Non-specific serine/threonine protein kinase [Vibrio chagasii]CAH7226155.1 Non-specific serine/threonine protein kinase [Vibrio chagasii]CAH7229115.1 Non-specific serine/threonine protein kinase [Vibrio chagasii]
MEFNSARSNSSPSPSRRAAPIEEDASSNQTSSTDEQLRRTLQKHGYTDLARLSSRVFKAQHRSWGLVTIKYAHELKHRHYLKQEAEFLYSNSDLDTQCTCPKSLDYFSNYQHDFLVLSHISGQTLREILNDSNLPDCSSFQFIGSLETAINQIHRLGFVHGDLKPSNIIMSEQGRAHLIDFGSVTQMGTDREKLRFNSYTPRYSREHTITSKLDDWFALTVILAELLDEAVMPSRYQVLLKQHR